MTRNLRYLVLLVSVVALLLPAAGAALARADVPATSIAPATSAPDSPVDVIVLFYQPPGPAETALIESLGGTVRRVYTIIPAMAATVPPSGIDTLRRDPRVESVDEDVTLHAAGQTLPWGVDRIDAELVHPTNKGMGVKVAVLDTGIDLDHPDLVVAGNVTFVAGTTTGDDDNGHGTAVAGIVGARDNDIGVIGVAPEAALYAVKVLNSTASGSTTDILSGIEWAANNGMQVINLSFGTPMNLPQALIDALDAAYNAGIVIVAGAGNGGNTDGTGNNIWTPARYAPVIAVGATNDQNLRSSVSSTGYELELMAPGVNIYTTGMGGGYTYLTTTSSAAPHVAGTAALLIASGLTNNVAVRNRMKDSAFDLGDTGWDSKYGCGLVNASQAISFSEPPDQTMPTTAISFGGTAGTNGWYVSNVTVTLTATDNPGGSGVASTKYSLDAGQTWNTYTSPFTVSTEGQTIVLASSWDNAGNNEGPPAYALLKIDKTPPTATETSSPDQASGKTKGVLMQVTYTASGVQDAVSGVASINHTLIDEYGDYSQYLGGLPWGTVWVEQYCKGGDPDGRQYTFRLTATDMAGNQAIAGDVTVVFRA
ncbi:MAG: S8 family peptidase [Chloroflexota bacterium]